MGIVVMTAHGLRGRLGLPWARCSRPGPRPRPMPRPWPSPWCSCPLARLMSSRPTEGGSPFAGLGLALPLSALLSLKSTMIPEDSCRPLLGRWPLAVDAANWALGGRLPHRALYPGDVASLDALVLPVGRNPPLPFPRRRVSAAHAADLSTNRPPRAVHVSRARCSRCCPGLRCSPSSSGSSWQPCAWPSAVPPGPAWRRWRPSAWRGWRPSRLCSRSSAYSTPGAMFTSSPSSRYL